MTPWKTSTDPPAEAGEYLCSDGQTVFMAWYHPRHGAWYLSDGSTYFAPLHVTHWMIKPALPERRPP